MNLKVSIKVGKWSGNGDIINSGKTHDSCGICKSPNYTGAEPRATVNWHYFMLQVVIVSDVEPKNLFYLDEAKDDYYGDADRALMDDLSITKDSVCIKFLLRLNFTVAYPKGKNGTLLLKLRCPSFRLYRLRSTRTILTPKIFLLTIRIPRL